VSPSACRLPSHPRVARLSVAAATCPRRRESRSGLADGSESRLKTRQQPGVCRTIPVPASAAHFEAARSLLRSSSPFGLPSLSWVRWLRRVAPRGPPLDGCS
jgi:hypothetical protein